MSWYRGESLIRASQTQVTLRRDRHTSYLSGGHVCLFWNRLAGLAGLPFDAQGRLVSGAWLEKVRALQPDLIVLVGLMQDVEVFGSIGHTLQAVGELADALQLPRDRFLLSPIPVWSQQGETLQNWGYWVQHGYQHGFLYWLLDTTPYNRLFLNSQPRSRFTSVSAYVNYVSQTSQALLQQNDRVRCVAPVYWRADSAWGLVLLQQLASLATLHEIAVSGLLPLGRDETDVAPSCFVGARRIVSGALELLSAARDKVKMVMPLAPVIPSGQSAPQHTPEHEPRNISPFGTLYRALCSAYLCEHGGYERLVHWLQPSLSRDYGMRYCLQDGGESTSGWWLDRMGQLRGANSAAEGSAFYLDVLADGAEWHRAPAGARLACFREDELFLLMPHLQGNRTIQVEWYGTGSQLSEVWETADASQLSETDQPARSLSETLGQHLLRWTSSTTQGAVCFARVKLSPSPPSHFGDLVTTTLIPDRLPRVDGIGDLDDLLVAVELEHPSVSSPVPRLGVAVHTGTYYVRGVESRYWVEPQSFGLNLQSGWNRVTLPFAPSMRVPPTLQDARGAFVLVQPPVRLAQRLEMQRVVREGQTVWRAFVPGELLEVIDEESLQPLYEVFAWRDLQEHSYLYDAVQDSVYTTRTDLLFGYVSDEPSLWIEEWVWCDDGQRLLSRRVPYLPMAVAYQMQTGRVFVPSRIERGAWYFERGIPPGLYLLRYLVDRSFCVFGRVLLAFTSQPSQAKLIYTRADQEWNRRLAWLTIDERKEATYLVSLLPQESRPQPVVAALEVSTSDVSLPGLPYHILVTAHDVHGAPLPNVWIDCYPIQTGGSVLLVADGGFWRTDRAGRLVLRAVPGSGEGRYRLQARESVASAELRIPPSSPSGLSGYVEYRRVRAQDEYDLLLLRVTPSDGSARYGVRLQALNGWLQWHLGDGNTVPTRLTAIDFVVPMQRPYGTTFSPVGWCVFRIPTQPVALRVTVETRQWREEHVLEV